MNSDESNDMMLNHPDIERVEQKREYLAEQDYNVIVNLSDEENTKTVVTSTNLDKENVGKLTREEIRQALQEEKRLNRLQNLEQKRLAEENAMRQRKEKALKGMKYLLTLSQKFSDFFSEKLYEESSDPLSKKIKKKELLGKRNKFQPTAEDMEEVVNFRRSASGSKDCVDITEQLKYFTGGNLHPYQVEGVRWLAVLQDNGINGILADEMGLGKTVQVIALICHLLEKPVAGPYLIVAPLSTLPNWESEFKRFAPKVPVVLFHGSQEHRNYLRRCIDRKYKVGDFSTYPVILTSYQFPTKEEKFLSRFEYQYIIVDEGHRIKNHETQLAQVLRRLTSSNRLLLTGTPLQNNIQELWSLLNFVMPQIFTNMDTFASLIMLEDMEDENKLLEQEEKSNVISTLHKVLAPFVLRRLKKDVLTDMVPKKEVFVYCPLSEMQRKLYAYVIDRNIKALYGEEDENRESIDLDEPRKKRRCVEKRKNIKYNQYLESDDEDITDEELFADYYEEDNANYKLMNQNGIKKNDVPYVVRLTMMSRIMMYKKIVNHPYLVHFPLDPNSAKKELLINEDIVNYSGKMMVLDAMLPKLKEKGHKVLIFSTLVMTIDLIEELMIMRGYTYRRLDGGLNLELRSESITEFNSDPNVLAFLVSTRAGGLGLNLTSADTVIFFDRDWNPQADIQAQDRCHRIGQTKPVMVYTFVSKNTIDELIIERGRQKRLLEKLVIKDGKFKNLGQSDKVTVESELKEMKELLNKENKKFEEVFSNQELDRLLDRSELYKMMNK